MDKILLDNMCFYGYHGVFSEETRLGQKFFIDMELSLDLTDAGKTDDLNKSVSYGDVFFTVKEIVEGKPYKLIEALAQAIVDSLFNEYSLIDSIKVRIKKPEAPVPGSYNFFAVEIVRSRSDKSLP